MMVGTRGRLSLRKAIWKLPPAQLVETGSPQSQLVNARRLSRHGRRQPGQIQPLVELFAAIGANHRSVNLQRVPGSLQSVDLQGLPVQRFHEVGGLERQAHGGRRRIPQRRLGRRQGSGIHRHRQRDVLFGPRDGPVHGQSRDRGVLRCLHPFGGRVDLDRGHERRGAPAFSRHSAISRCPPAAG